MMKNRMNDLISRQAAIDAIAAYMPSLTTADGSVSVDYDIFVAQEACVDCIQIIHELPPAQPEQKEPCPICEKLEYGDTLYVYSDWNGGTGYINGIKYCPVCGRKLKE